jgi:heme exporter protein B
MSLRFALLGFGLGLVMQVLIIAVQNEVDYRDLGVATSAAMLFRLIGGSLGTAVFGIFYNVRWTRQFWDQMLVLALGTWAVTVIGTIFSALTVNIRLREVMLPMLTYPILAPALMAAMRLTAVLMAGEVIAGNELTWLKLLIGFDVIFTAVSLMLVETVLVG